MTDRSALEKRIALNFSEIIWSHANRQGRVSNGWSLVRNRPIAQFTD